ncbi:energy transducer TonB [Sphingomonas sp.]|uniref:energy transducer TonB n=1 Tax=Sphingomonas sp. TaxID=28214 RepID=UPI001EC907C4|nr:energy transducer TonB [Sphingomonas sp.]MBX3594213.1 energy transducer TonB [Sphingomonas sp.]
MLPLFLSLIAQAASAPPPPAPPPAPPVVTMVAARAHLIDFVPGEIRCGSRAVSPIASVRPFTVGATLGTDPVAPVDIAFSIDADGRPTGVAQLPRPAGRFAYLDASDLEVVTTLLRFVSGGPIAGCRVTFSPRETAVAEASIERLAPFIALNSPGLALIRRDALARLRMADCGGQRPPRFLLRGYPDLARVRPRRGEPDVSIIAYDIDAQGVPVRLRPLAGTGNVELDASAIDAFAKSRFVPGGARLRCTAPAIRWPAPSDAPSAPPVASFRPKDATCPQTIVWERAPTPSYPTAYRRRAVEGWAIIGFDIAPWGATGNVRVLASAPSVSLGEPARRSVASARAATSTTGARGCVTRVLFRMAADDGAASDGEPPAPF